MVVFWKNYSEILDFQKPKIINKQVENWLKWNESQILILKSEIANML